MENNYSYSKLNTSYGGAVTIKSWNKIVIFEKNIITNNNCSGGCTSYGGGIYLRSISSKSVQATENVIRYNSSKIGSGFFIYSNGKTIVSKNIITQNQSDGIRSERASSIEISENIIKSGTGTGIYITSSLDSSITCSINNNIVMNYNNDSSVGGGIYVDNYKLINIHQNLITTNSAIKGAGIYLKPVSSLFLSKNTIASNIAKALGGGIYIETSRMQNHLSLKNNIFWNNIANTEGDDIFLHGFGANPRELINNTVREIAGYFDKNTDNISTDPLFFSPETGDYHLQPNSPCINAGYHTLTSNDLDGTPRIGIADMGAYEYNPTFPHPADTNQNFIIEENEYTAYNNSWHQNLPWPTEPITIPIEYNTRAGFLIENGGSYTNSGEMKPLCWKPAK
jgi:hypothetical protein